MHWIYEYELQCRPPSCKWKELEMDDILNCSIAAQKEEKYYMFSKPDPVIGALPNIPRNKLWKSLIISGLKLNDDDIQLKHLKNLIHVDISENQLTRLPIENLPTNVEELQLNKNYITNLPTKENILQNVPKLRLVNLRNNKIKILSVKEVQLLPVIGSVFMRGNPFVCNCTLNHFITWVKANGSSLSQNGKYDIQELRCDSPKEIMDQRIQDISSEDVCQSSASIILKAGISAMVAVIILTLLIVVFLYMKRRRDYKAQILNGFQKLLQQENTLYMKQETFGKDNETFVFDCFVASEDTEHDNKYLEKNSRT
uniref:leucine-rich repeat-containing protein 38-like n=1 Tax=Styela clava TaxID=7725 RepID=UPI001939571D|nr:leucine-rich repeat-containing protein 38-like [Styela clava]